MINQDNLDEDDGSDIENDEYPSTDISNNIQINPEESVVLPHQNGEINPLEVCPICMSDKPNGTEKSIKSHIQYYVRQGDPDHIDGVDEAYTLIDDWVEAHGEKTKPSKKSTTPKKFKVSRTSDKTITTEPIRAKYTDVERADREELAKSKTKRQLEKDNLNLENDIISLRKKINQQQGELDDQKFGGGSSSNLMSKLVDVALSKGQGSGKDDKSYEELKFWRDIAMQNSTDYKKSLEGQNKELIVEIKELRNDVENLSKDNREFGPMNEEMNKATVRAVNTFTDIFGSSWKHNIEEMSRFQHAAQTLETGTPVEEQPVIERVEDDHREHPLDIIRRVAPHLISEE